MHIPLSRRPDHVIMLVDKDYCLDGFGLMQGKI